VHRLGGVLVVPLTLVVSVALASPALAQTPVPDGYQVAGRAELAPGVEHLRLVRTSPPMVVNVARLAPDAPVSLRAILSNEQVAGPDPLLERTSSMCSRIRCIVALNGDFAAVGSDQPIGGLVTAGQLLRSPSSTHHQLSLTKDGRLLSGSFEWSGKLVPTDLQPLAVEGVNVAPSEDRVVLYTPAFGPSTESTGPGAAIAVRMVEPAGPLHLGQTTLVELTSLQEGVPNLPIPADGGLLAGEGKGAEALRQLWGRVQAGTAGSRALLRLETAETVVESLGGSPILLRDGKRWFADVDDNFTRGRHPRTLVGWTPSGETLLVTVDGRQPEVSVGMTLAESAELLLALGATEAINLDGGGSTTFVANGVVANQPSDVAVRRGGQEVIRHAPEPGDRVIGRVERPVASALAVVPSNEVAAPPVDPLAGPSLGLPQALALRAVSSTDPGSVPDGGLPALVSEESQGLGGAVRAGAVAINALVGVSLAAFALKRRTAARPAPAD
jgi:exopolysaccharide biosynthesis protein